MSTTKSYATELALQTIPVLLSCGQSSLCMGDVSVRKADAWFKELNMWNTCGVMCGVRVGKPPEYMARWAIRCVIVIVANSRIAIQTLSFVSSCKQTQLLMMCY